MASTDLRSLAEIDVRDEIPPEQLLPALQTAPFLHVPGTFNTRDLGLISGSSSKIRPGYIYRSGALGGLASKPEGKTILKERLGVRRVFDLRSQEEHAGSPDPEIDGVTNIWSVDVKEQVAAVDLAPFVEGEGEKGYALMYMGVMAMYKPSFRGVLEHVRDRPAEPFLFHCTAGRDRTGVLSGMLLTFAGEGPETVTTDFLLSRIGTEPAREQLKGFARKGSGAESDDTPGFYNLVSLKAVCWQAFLDAVQKEYGGFDGYATKTLGFSEEDLVKIKENLTKKL